MKKLFLLISTFFYISALFALDLPDELAGIWEGKDRFVFFEQEEGDENPKIVIILKEYYGWFYDRAAESPEKSQEYTRNRNIPTPRTAENITFSFSEISKAKVSDVWELNLNYSKYEKNLVPVCVIDGKMYLDFLVKDLPELLQNDDAVAFTASGVVDENPYNGFWRGNVASEGIKVASQVEKENIPGFYIQGDKLYDIRYWKSGMDFTDEKVLAEYDEDSFYVDKHLFSAGNVYSCTKGRRTYIRNMQPSFEFHPENYVFNSEKTVLARDKEPYLVRLADKSTFEDLITIIKEANSRRKPPRPPLFPPKDLDWHWDIINMLEKDNELIQKVRARQKIRY